VEDDSQVRFNRDAAVIAPVQGVAKDVADAALPFAGPVVIGVVFRGIPGGVLDMDMGDAITDLGPELPGILTWPGAGLGAVRIEDGVGGVEDPFEARHLVEEFERVSRAHAAMVHAVFVNGLKAGVEEDARDLLNPLYDLGRDPILVVVRFEAHDADVACVEALHARDGAMNFGEGDVERVADGFRPVHDGGSEAVDFDPGVIELFDDALEGGIRDVMEIGLGITWNEDIPGFDVLPAEFLGGLDLGVDRVACFVANAGIDHDLNGWVLDSVRGNVSEKRLRPIQVRMPAGDLNRGFRERLPGGRRFPGVIRIKGVRIGPRGLRIVCDPRGRPGRRCAARIWQEARSRAVARGVDRGCARSG
jgi:hypothetical protein